MAGESRECARQVVTLKRSTGERGYARLVRAPNQRTVVDRKFREGKRNEGQRPLAPGRRPLFARRITVGADG